jgi:chromosome segregation ATPase
MAEELRDKEVSAEDVKTLRRALELAGEEGGSVDARLDRIQGDVADLRAYTDALEEFLDENGTGEQLIEDARRQLDEFEETVEEMESRIDAAEGTAETAEAEVGEVRAEVDDIGATVDDVEDSVGELEAALDSVETDLEEVRESMAGEEALDRLDDLESEVSELQEWQTQIKETFGG